MSVVAVATISLFVSYLVSAIITNLPAGDMAVVTIQGPASNILSDKLKIFHKFVKIKTRLLMIQSAHISFDIYHLWQGIKFTRLIWQSVISPNGVLVMSPDSHEVSNLRQNNALFNIMFRLALNNKTSTLQLIGPVWRNQPVSDAFPRGPSH